MFVFQINLSCGTFEPLFPFVRADCGIRFETILNPSQKVAFDQTKYAPSWTRGLSIHFFFDPFHYIRSSLFLTSSKKQLCLKSPAHFITSTSLLQAIEPRGDAVFCQHVALELCPPIVSSSPQPTAVFGLKPPYTPSGGFSA